MEKDIKYKYGWIGLDENNKEEEGKESQVPEAKDAAFAPQISLDDPSLYINQELSWLKFNERVLEEALDPSNPLLERVKFLAICGSNLDEFFMIRVAGLRKQLVKGALRPPPDGMTPLEQLTSIRKELLPILEKYSSCWRDILLPELAKNGIHIKKVSDLEQISRTSLREYFEQMILPTLTPLAMDLTHPFPMISNLSLNLAVVVKHGHKGKKYARVKVPTSLFPRLIELPKDDQKKLEGNAEERTKSFVFLEDIIASNLDLLFPGLEVVSSYPFRITRNAEIEISLDQASDLLTVMEDSIDGRRAGFPVRFEVDESMPEHLRDMFAGNLRLSQDMIYQVNSPLGTVDFWKLLSLDRPDLKDAPFLPYTPTDLADEKKIFSSISQKDYMLFHPYDSFASVVNFLKKAAADPEVLAIKMVLYRIDKKSPIIDSLIEARHNGKSVVALVELKAKFDEQNNIIWAKALEHAGVHVIYGLEDLKVHAKICLVVRRENDKIVQYAHFSTGNYNAVTARAYSDIGYLTTNKHLCSEAAHLLNALTGYSEKDDYHHLLVAPKKLRQEMQKRIEREIEAHKKTGEGRIVFKLNGLVDRDIIHALYRASMAGVKIEINVRGLCCLRPGIRGVSENITVSSIAGRFLEHARVYYFKNGGEEEVLLGSADMMPRNLDRRVEILFPVPDKKIKKSIINLIFKNILSDNVKTRRLLSDGTYERVRPAENEKEMNSQQWFIENRGVWNENR
jgi:polyphosphate kinase